MAKDSIKSWWLLRLSWAWLLLFSIGGSCLTLPGRDGPDQSLTKRQGGHKQRLVYRGDARPPETIRALGGFLPRPSPEGSDVGYSLDNHVRAWTIANAHGKLDSFDTRYVSASTSSNVASHYADKHGGYVYSIKTTPNAVDVNLSYRKHGQPPPFAQEEEYAFFGGISWNQVKMYKTKDTDWVINGEYNMDFNKFEAAGAHPQLLGTSTDSSTTKSAALQLMSSDENVKAKEIGAAPGFCFPLSKRATPGRPACEPKFETAKYESKWVIRDAAQSAPDPHEPFVAASLEHSAEDVSAKFLEQEFGRLVNKFGLTEAVKAKQERRTFAEVKDKLQSSMHKGSTRPGKMSAVHGETALQLLGIGLWAKDVFDSLSTDSSDLSRATVITSIIPLVGCGTQSLSNNAHDTTDLSDSFACIAADSLLMSPAWPVGLAIHGFRALVSNPSLDEFRKAFANTDYLYKTYRGQWLQHRNALLDHYGNEKHLLKHIGIEYSARALVPTVLATESAGKLREHVLQLSASSEEKSKILRKLLNLLDSELCAQLSEIKKQLESEINDKFDALFEAEYAYFYGNFSENFERQTVQAEMPRGAARGALSNLEQQNRRKDGYGPAPGPWASQFTRSLTRQMMGSLLSCATISDGKTIVMKSSSLDTPEACSKIKGLELFVMLSDDPGSETNDKIGANLIGSAGKATLEIANSPDRGFEQWTAVDMRSSFGSDEIDIRGIDTLELTSEGTLPLNPSGNFRFDPFYNDPWKVEGTRPADEYWLETKRSGADIELRATCVETGSVIEYLRLLRLNIEVVHPAQHTLTGVVKGLYRDVVKSFKIAARDWQQESS